MERKYDRKAWSEMYLKRATELLKEKEDPAASRLRRDLQATTKAGTLIARKIGKRVRIKLKNKAFSCHRTPENLTFPKDLKDWKTHWGTCLMCSICDSPAMFDCTSCKTCNAIAHRLCVAEQLVLDNNSSLSELSSLSLGSSSLIGGRGAYGGVQEGEGEDEDEEDIMFGDGPEGEDAFVATLQALGMDEYSCAECQRGYQDDVDFYEKLKVSLTRDRRFVLAQRLVCRRILGYIERKRFKKLKRGLILIQSGIRKRRAKRVFFHWRRSQMRVVCIELLHLPPESVRANDLIVLTAVDPMKGQQLFRFDKDAARALEEGFMIPGITSHTAIVITICRVEEHTANTVFVVQEQCQLSLRDIDAFLEKLPYSLSFGKRVWWAPTDPKKDFPYRVVLEKTGGIVPGHAAATSSASAETKDTHGGSYMSKPGSPAHLTPAAAAAAASAKDAKGLKSPPRSAPGTTAPTPASAKDRAESKEAKALATTATGPQQQQQQQQALHSWADSFAPASPGRPTTAAAVTSSTPQPQQQEAKTQTPGGTNTSHFVRVLYLPQNPVSSMVLMISGPPLDVLRAPALVDLHALAKNKSAAAGTAASKADTRDQGPQGRATRWWLCLCNLRLYFYQNYGDIRPRLVSEILEARVIVDPMYTKGNVVSILHKDSRLWLLELGEAKLAEKFVFAVSESQRAHAKQQGSIFMRTADVRRKTTWGSCDPQEIV